MTKPPIHAAIDSVVKCAICGKPGIDSCCCWITLECPKCHRKQRAIRDSLDPPKTVRVQIKCPKCDDGDFDSPRFFNAAGKELDGDPNTFKHK